MSDFKWTHDIELGIEALDDDHRRIVGVLNKLNHCAENNGEDFAEILDQLDKYSLEHFQAEEQAMLDYGFEGYDAHKQQHETFRHMISRLRLLSGEKKDQEVAVKSSIALINWLLEHIIGHDLELQPIFRFKNSTTNIGWKRIWSALTEHTNLKQHLLLIYSSQLATLALVMDGFSGNSENDTLHLIGIIACQLFAAALLYSKTQSFRSLTRWLHQLTTHEQHIQPAEILRTDEVGDIARSLEFFRRQSIKDKLIIDGYSLSPHKMSKQKISLKKRAIDIRKLRKKADIDMLTGAFSRGHFFELFEQQIELSNMEEYPLGLLMLDIDHFKRINDTYGHQAGDEVLTALVKELQSHLRGDDFIGRVGGEEFAIILPNAPIHKTNEIANRLCQSVKALSIEYNRQTIPITISIGATQCLPPHPDTTTLLKNADNLLYRAKNEGRNRVCSND